MDESKIVDILIGIHGPDALDVVKSEAEQYRAQGNDLAYNRALRRVKLTEEQIKVNAGREARRSSIHPNTSPLFAGLTNIVLSGDKFEITDGLHLESVFAHVMAPYIVAFSPAEKGKPHPGPWKAASGGLGFDITVQINLCRNARPTNFDRLNTLWWLTSLIRLHYSTGIRSPIISNKCFRNASEEDPIFWPIELDNRGIAFDGYKSDTVVPEVTLQWIRHHFLVGAKLMEDSKFNLAYRALESAQRASSLVEAVILIWSAVEALIRPGSMNVAHRLSLGIATYLETDLPSRDKLYARAKELYAIRGQVTHAAEPPKADDVIETFNLARRCFLKAIEANNAPDFSNLEINWKLKK